MSLQAPRRGRPKGSGIDDQKFLEKMAAMIAENPELKPTTAIKSLGVTDPSAVRRLRDKFHVFAADLRNAAAKPAAATASRVVTASVEDNGYSLSELPRAVSPKAAPSPSTGCALSAADSIPTPFDVLAMWYGMGMSALTTAMATQAAVARSLTRLPHVDLALRQHLALNEMAMAMVATRPAARPTLH